ncbi:MAG: hypothetical protein KKF62_07050 [Bacteroidetes bacterium]|nr:hypothetical protein [Bacteroidota bacterium]MBU1115712.1 hypothetical protein [Bacteroidota bacterium]MBU1799931.1 hypothetical protein [Bacteroidota bacterium]
MNDKDFVNKWIEKIESNFRKFPDDYLADIETEIFEMPGKTISLGSELFGQFEVVDLNGNPILQTDDYNHIKFILYANRLKPKSILKPKDTLAIKKVVKEYELQLDSIIKEIKIELNKVLPTSDFLRVSNQIFNALNLQRY